jgi:hypothetical protein
MTAVAGKMKNEKRKKMEKKKSQRQNTRQLKLFFSLLFFNTFA